MGLKRCCVQVLVGFIESRFQNSKLKSKVTTSSIVAIVMT